MSADSSAKVFAPVVTPRLLLRPVEATDLDALLARRNDPDVASFQSWSLPFARARAAEIVQGAMANSGPTSDEWWMLTIVESDGGEIIGDLAIHPTWEGRSVEIGYTLDRASWGRGFATEAVTGLVDRLFAEPLVTRVHAMLHPENTASLRVLERTGFVFEGRTRLSYWVGDDNTDDLLYGMTRSDWQEWARRPTAEPTVVRLVALDAQVLDAVRRVEAPRSREGDYVDVDRLLVDALASAGVFSESPPGFPEVRAIDVDGTIAGVVVEGPEIVVVVDRRHAGRGIEDRARSIASSTTTASSSGVRRMSDEGLSETGR